MLRPALLIFSIAVVSACTHSPTKKMGAPAQAVYPYAIETVWNAARLALRYPIRIDNIDQGTLETEWIKAMDGFQPPDTLKALPSSSRYRITLLFLKGKIDGKSSTKVTVLKRIEKVRNFFSEPEVLETDRLEEKLLLYRIDRELRIATGIRRSVERDNSH